MEHNYKCFKCNALFVTATDLQGHLIQSGHRKSPSFYGPDDIICRNPICYEKFPTWKLLQEHLTLSGHRNSDKKLSNAGEGEIQLAIESN